MDIMQEYMAVRIARWYKKKSLANKIAILMLIVALCALVSDKLEFYFPRVPDEIPDKIISFKLSLEDPGKPSLPANEIQKTPFFGRREEIEALFKFAEDNRKFSWWMVCGEGGTGKSRLAEELALRLSKKLWNAGFIDLSRSPSVTWNTWKPDKPTFIVVDNAALYVAMRNHSSDNSPKPNDLVSIIKSLSEHADSFEYPVRLLLLERTYKQQDATQQDGIQQGIIYTPWFQTLKDHTEKDASCHTPDSAPLELGPLVDKDLIDIAQNVLNERPPKDFLAKLEKIDPQKRPLYAIYLATYMKEYSRPEQHRSAPHNSDRYDSFT